MERREDLHRHGCSIAKQTILTTHPSGLQTRVSVELANFDALCVHSECSTKPKRPMWEGSPFLARRGILGGVSAHGTPVLGRRSDAVNEGRLSQQCTPVMRRREVESPGGSPLPARRCEEELETEVDNSVISGWLKFRDNKRMNTTLEYKYYVIKLKDELPDPSFPRIICVPKSWIKVHGYADGRVAVELPQEDYSVTAGRIRSEEPGDDWRLFWAFIQDKKNDYETAINNARIYNEALLHQAQQQQEGREHQAEHSEVNEQQVIAEEESNQSQNEEISEDNLEENEIQDLADEEENQSQDKEISDDNSEENEIQDLADGEENQSQDEEISEDNSEENEPRHIVENEQHQSQNEEVSDDSLEENELEDLLEDLNINMNENDLNHIKTNPKENWRDWSEAADIDSDSSDNSWVANGSDYPEMDSNTSEASLSGSEENVSKNKRKLTNTPYSENLPISSLSESDQSSEEYSPRQAKKNMKQNKKKYYKQSQRKRKAEENTGNVKKRKLTNTSHSDNAILSTPSTSQIALSPLNTKRKKRMSRRKFLEVLDLQYKHLEDYLTKLYEKLEILGTNLNKISEFFGEAISIVTLMIENEDIDDTTSLTHYVGRNSGHQISKQRQRISENVNISSENTPNCDIGQLGSTQLYEDNTDKTLKWTLRYEEFKPQPGLIELLPGGGIYVSEAGLLECKQNAGDSPHKLAKNLLIEIFSDEALRNCTLLGWKQTKPGLDDYARRQLITYVKQYCFEEGLGEIEEKSIASALRKKLWEYNNKEINSD